MSKIGESSGDTEAKFADSGKSLWEKFVVQLVDPNSNKWFENFGPEPISTIFPNLTGGTADVKKISHVTRLDLKIVPQFEEVEGSRGEIQNLEESVLGQKLMSALEAEGLRMEFRTTWLLNHDDRVENDSRVRLDGEWVTEANSKFLQSFELYKNASGEFVGYWFVDLLASPVDIASFNSFDLISADGSTVRKSLAVNKVGLTSGQVSTCLQIPGFIKQLAYFCETPFPSTPIMALGRDSAFSDVPETARPQPFFAFKRHGEVRSAAPFNPLAKSSTKNRHSGTRFPTTVQFGWKLTAQSFDYLGGILPLLANGVASAMSLVEDGYENYRDASYPAPFDLVLGSPCANFVDHVEGGSRLSYPQWIPATHIAAKMQTSLNLLTESRKLSSEGKVQESRVLLEQIVNDGLGPGLTRGINDLLSSHLLLELRENPNGIAKVEYLADQAIRHEMLIESTNAIVKLGTAYYLIGDLEKSVASLLRALEREDGAGEAEASYVISLLELARGNELSSTAFKNRSDAAGGFEAPDFLGGASKEASAPLGSESELKPESGFENTNESRGNSYPTNWSGIFEALPERSQLPELIANFGSKFRLAGRLSSNAFEGDTDSSDAYYVMLKLSLLYSAIEAWERLVGKGTFWAEAPDVARELSANKSFLSFLFKLTSVLSSEPLRKKVDALFEGRTEDIAPLLEAIRHGFFHSKLTANNLTLGSNSKLRALLLKAYSAAFEALDSAFIDWAEKTRRWRALESVGDDDLMIEAKTLNIAAGYPRSGIELKFRIELTEYQWGIVVEELWCEGDEDVEVMIEDIMRNLQGLEEAYRDWEKFSRETRADGKLDEDKNSQS